MLDTYEGSTKSDKVYEYLKEKILISSYKPGDRIVMREVSRQLGVSDIPVREAINKLASEGLVELKSHSGARVTTLDMGSLEEIFLIRVELESLATRLAAKSATQEEISKLESYVRQMEESHQKNDIQEYRKYNRKFHQLLYIASGAPVLSNLIESLYFRSESSRTIFSLDPENLRISNEEHRAIVEALREKNEDKAAKIIRIQKERGFKNVLNALKISQSFFEEFPTRK